MCQQGLQDKEEMEAHLEKLKEAVSSVEAVLHRTMVPNLKALEKMREVKEKLQGVTEGILLFILQLNCMKTNKLFHLKYLIIQEDLSSTASAQMHLWDV